MARVRIETDMNGPPQTVVLNLVCIAQIPATFNNHTTAWCRGARF